METSVEPAIAGADLTRPLDALFVNAPLRDYTERPRVNEFNFSVNLQFGEATVTEVRQRLVELSRAQHDRTSAAA